MKRILKAAMIVAGVGAMLGFAGCGGSASGDSAKDVALKKLKESGFDKIEFVSEKVSGDQSLVITKITVAGSSEETKVYCSKVNGKWTVTKLD